MPDIEPLLKNLRLSGISESLAQRNKEAIESKMSYAEFLALLLQDEVQRREMKKFSARFKRARINMNKTIEQFDFGFNPNIDQKKVKDIASCRFIHEKVPVLIVGPCGTGKSHLAQGIAHCAIRNGIDVLFFTQTQLLKTLQAARAIGEYDKKFKQLVNVPLLIIDDFGLKPFRTPQDEDFHDLVAERYENASTIITSNLEFSEWGDAFPNKILGAATIDRLAHGAYKIAFDGPSYRTMNGGKNDKK
ncbi:IS21-like element helper ATPase IstB [Legionella impletisoli]|nr:IS21-like element helper ATPase IstB [Legionella impletisoli]